MSAKADSSNVQPAGQGIATTAHNNIKRWRRASLFMTVTFSVNHATVTTPTIYSSSVLVYSIGNYSNAILYVVTMITSLTVAPLVANNLGPKRSLLVGLSLYTVYAFCFALAAFFCEEPSADGQGCDVAGVAQWTFALVGSALGGLGAGVLWTAQGSAFTAIVETFVGLEQQVGHRVQIIEEPEIFGRVTSELSSAFAFWYLVIECIVKVMFTILQKYASLPASSVFFIWSGLAAASTGAFSFAEDVQPKVSAANTSGCGKAAAAVRLWSDPAIWLLAFTNLTFGFSVAWLNGYVNSHFLKEALDNTNLIGSLGAINAFIAGLSSKLFGRIARLYGKGPNVLVGALCFLSVGILSKITAPDGKGPGGWGWGILAFYLLQGLGRGVYESTNKGVFGDFFPGVQGVGAFANVMMQSTLSSSLGFVLAATNTQEAMIFLLVGFAILTYPCFALAKVLRTRTGEMSAPASDPADQKETSFCGVESVSTAAGESDRYPDA